MLKPGGVYLLLGMVHPHSKLDITGEQIIRKCLTIKGLLIRKYSLKYVWRTNLFSFALIYAGIHNYAPRHLDQSVEFLEKTVGKYPYEDIMGPTYELSNLVAAMKLATEKVYNRVLIKPEPLS